MTKSSKKKGVDNKTQKDNGLQSEKSEFQWMIWTLFALENWILDFGRPIAMLVSPQEWFPLNMPSIGDYFHMAYNVITPFCIYYLMNKASKKSNQMLINLCVIFFIMGASIHLVGDSINHRLSLVGYQFHLSLEDNPIMKSLQPKDLVKSFELLYFYDEVLGHYMCAVYYWYLVTEGQITPLFLFTLVYMHTVLVYNLLIAKKKIDQNGQFLMSTFQITIILVGVWCYCFWDDEQLRKKYPVLIYVPEPWSVYSLHFKEYYNLF
ncbi:unnamed protein product [Brachionus calyciflorus]|uniref:CLN6 n=1 Tax=Brachionus calyciflorus TaxID=104777 RepID=A0A813M8T8_9BILA|nr:unnamed protein product [Brachionus calyciflorus]